MDKNMAGLIAAVGALVAGSAQAANTPPLAVNPVLQATSYADLLKPIPNALEVLKAQNEASPATFGGDEQPKVETVQYHHHHHHHHHRYRRVYHHHHHHHHNYY
jgi:hypothetical protein